MNETDSTAKARENQADIQNRSRTVINIWNVGGEASYGWCGLNNATLTSDSFGNTLVEMNYSVQDDERWKQGEEARMQAETIQE